MSDLEALVVASPFIPLLGILAASFAIMPYRTAVLGPRIMFTMFALVIGAMIVSFKGFSPVAVNAGFLGGCIIVSLWPLYYVMRARRAGTPEGALELALPFFGRWRCAAGGPLAELNHHADDAAQRYACDFYVPNALGWPSAPWSRANDRFPGYGRDVLAPADGAVVRVSDGQPEGTPPRWAPDSSKRPFGNHVVIEIAGGFCVLAHLKPGSICVKSGQRLHRGDRIGACGNSGASTMPHLHVHVQDRPNPGKGKGVPALFRDAAGRLCAPVTGDVLIGETSG